MYVAFLGINLSELVVESLSNFVVQVQNFAYGLGVPSSGREISSVMR